MFFPVATDVQSFSGAGQRMSDVTEGRIAEMGSAH